MKKFLSMLLILSMVFALVACGDEKEKDPSTTNPDATPTTPVASGEKRVINIGTWYESYYTSAHHKIEDNPKVDNVEKAEMQLQNMRNVEAKYNIELYYKNLTWDGVIESINTTIMAGNPTCDIYMVDLQFGIPAVLAGYGEALEDFLTEEEMTNEQFQNFKLPGADKTYLFKAQYVNTDGYPLGYNKALIAEANLEDPYALYQRGEWTWDVFMDYMVKLTDADNQKWGYRAPWTVTLTQLLFSNGASIASPKPNAEGKIVQGLDSKETTEVLNFMRDMYVTNGVTFWNSDCDSDWDSNLYSWGEGKIAFFHAAAWIIQAGDPEQQIDLGVVPWPTGPSVKEGQKLAQFNQTSGTFYMIAKNIKDPKLIYNVMKDYTGWYGDDLELRDDTEWAEQWMAGSKNSETNFDTLCSMTDEPEDLGFDLWDQVKYDEAITIHAIICNDCEVSQFIETNKNLVQDYLDTNFAK